MALMCFSTLRFVRPRPPAIAALLAPAAIEPRTSRSTGLSSLSGERARRRRASTSDCTTFGSIADAPPATALIVAVSWRPLCTRSLSRYARRSEPVVSSSVASAASQ